jgi:hypothetical protein
MKEHKEKKKKKPERGIETMFRITAANHQRLSDMADNKANIMITVNSIILSVVLSVLIRRIEEYPHLGLPSFILATVNLFSLIFSLLATRPSIPHGTFSEKELEKGNVNLLFFGNFYKMSLPSYTAGMMQMMENNELLYKSMIRDIYFQGIVLSKKYHLLRIAYNIFMFGIVVSVLAFIIASIRHGRI